MCREGGGFLKKKSVAIQVDNCVRTIALVHSRALFKNGSEHVQGMELQYTVYAVKLSSHCQTTVDNAELIVLQLWPNFFYFELEGVYRCDQT